MNYIESKSGSFLLEIQLTIWLVLKYLVPVCEFAKVADQVYPSFFFFWSKGLPILDWLLQLGINAKLLS